MFLTNFCQIPSRFLWKKLNWSNCQNIPSTTNIWPAKTKWLGREIFGEDFYWWRVNCFWFDSRSKKKGLNCFIFNLHVWCFDIVRLYFVILSKLIRTKQRTDPFWLWEKNYVCYRIYIINHISFSVILHRWIVRARSFS